MFVKLDGTSWGNAMTGWGAATRRLAMAASVLPLFAAVAMAAEDITVFDWSGYEDPANYPAYVKEVGKQPRFSFFADEEEALQKLRAGFKADLSHPCSQSVRRWQSAGLLEPLDTSKLKYWGELDPKLRDLPGFVQDGKHYIVPYEWGNTGLTYRTDLVPSEDVQSLQVFADPKYAGKISIGDNVDDAYALAVLATGKTDWTNLSDADFEAASEFLRKVHQNVRMYWTDNTNISQALASGEVEIAWTWNDTPTTLKASGQPVAMNKATKEGLSTWVCGYVVLKDHPGPEKLIYDYLNAVSDPAVSTYLVDVWGYGHANKTGMEAIDPAVLKAKSYADVEKFREKTLFQSPLPPEIRQKMIAEFEKIKAGF